MFKYFQCKVVCFFLKEIWQIYIFACLKYHVS
jgi:hypothetical protein